MSETKDFTPDFNKSEEPEVDRKTELLKLLSDLVAGFDGESNIPINHHYWTLLKEYRKLLAAQ